MVAVVAADPVEQQLRSLVLLLPQCAGDPRAAGTRYTILYPCSSAGTYWTRTA